MNNDSIRIGVLGELGVGKSELVHRICHPQAAGPSSVSSWAGPTVDILDFERPDRQGHVWIEFIVIPSETRHPRSRQMVYSIGLDALFLVCDCTVHRSFLRAAEWMEEATTIGGLKDVPIALILGGPTPVDWAPHTALARIIEPLVETYHARVLNLSGYTGNLALEPRQRQLIHDFFEVVVRHKKPSKTL
ncbi:Rab-like protein 3 [Coemansia sp. RSA 2611]|nr:Rab-like protein 3 [Coemansia sp. RSA 2708]KAJ2300455.1 Rab-like protein 3 [Coemansia sp. RSA 2705]KAJ2355076.1 Rab-like protein 3 [Coemansia sp. RSA 2611]KAJ2731465.1 Rab-like protein 3 [Coemansia sp. Cherry 401B]